MKKFIEKYCWIIGILFFLPIVVLVVFHKSVFATDEGIVSFVCAVFTYYGTIVLSLVTVLQNEKLTMISERNALIEEIRLSNQYHPSIIIESIKDGNEIDLEAGKLYKNGFGMVKQIHNIASNTIYVVLKNIGNSEAYNSEIFEYGYAQPEKLEETPPIFDYKRRKIVEISENDTFFWELHFEENAMFSFEFNLCYQNEFGNEFYNHVIVVLIDVDGSKTAQIGIGEQIKGNAIMDLKQEYYRTDVDYSDINK